MNAEIDQLTRLESPMHHWEPRWKLVSCLVMAFVFASVDSQWSALAALSVSISLNIASRLPVGYILKRLGELHLFFIPSFIILPFTVDGTPMEIGPFTLSHEGLLLALKLYLRALSVVTLSLVVLLSTPMNELLRAAQRLGFPKVLIQIALLTYRYVFTLRWELSRIRLALKTRAFQYRTNLHTYKTLANIIGMTLIRSMERTDRIYRAMLCRGYTGNIPTLRTDQTTFKDAMLSGVCLLVTCVILGVDLWIT